MKVCPTDPTHNRFIATAHVTEDWVVDSNGDFPSRPLPTPQPEVLMYTTQDVTQAAVTAAQKTVELLAVNPANKFVTQQQLILLSGLTPPSADDPIELHDMWRSKLITLRQTWRYAVLDLCGRWPKTVHGNGFEILQPKQNIRHADTKVLSDVTKVIQKGLRIVRGTRDTDLDARAKQQKINSELRFSQLRASAQSSQQQAERERSWRADTPTPPSTPPTPSLEDNS